MPQPYTPRPGARVDSHYRILELRPECAIQIANVGTAWALLEEQLAQVVGSAAAMEVSYLPAEGPAGGHIMQGMTNRVAMASVGAIDSLSAKLDVIERVLAISVSPELCAQFENLRPSIRKAAGSRNAVAHCRWHITDAYPDDVLSPEVPRRTYTRYTVGDLRELADRISNLTNDIVRFHIACFSYLGDEARRKAPPPPAP